VLQQTAVELAQQVTDALEKLEKKSTFHLKAVRRVAGSAGPITPG
jgi:hypothetical protein